MFCGWYHFPGTCMFVYFEGFEITSCDAHNYAKAVIPDPSEVPKIVLHFSAPSTKKKGHTSVLLFSPNCQDDAEQPVGEDEVAVQLGQVEEGLGGGHLDPVEVVNLEDRVQLEIKSQLQNQIFHLMIFRLKYIDLWFFLV